MPAVPRPPLCLQMWRVPGEQWGIPAALAVGLCGGWLPVQLGSPWLTFPHRVPGTEQRRRAGLGGGCL